MCLKTTRGHSSQQFREAHRRLERVVLNTLAEQMPLCRLIFGPVQCYENFILRLRRLASSSEMPIHLSRGQRAPATTNQGSLTTYNSESKAYGRGGGVGRGRGVGTDLGVALGVPVGVAVGV